MKKVWYWLTSNIGICSVLFILAFIPLYPKLPVINVIRTWVYIRLEDFLVAAIIAIYIFLKIRLRVLPKTPLTWPIITYWIIGILSAIFSILFIGPKLVGYFPHLVAFHFLRRVEYMMLFFIAYDVISQKTSRIMGVIWTLAASVLGIIVYGFGQKLWGWPAFLTMNEEFAKGIPLRLPPTARIPSTFGGHYDLAAFIVLTIPILVTLIFAVKKVWQKLLFLILSLGSLTMLLLTESRTSFLVYLVGITATLIWYKKKTWIVPVLIVSFVMLNFVEGASERFYKTFRYNDVIIDLSTGRPVGTLASLDGGTAVVQKSQSPAEESLPTGSQYIGLPTSATGSGQVKTISYSSVNLASGSGEIATVSGSFLIQKAFVYDISITTRFQGQWPNAITAFKRNILLGSGYSTLSVAADGDYLRMLGETGLLGTLGFLGILFTAFVLFFQRKNSLEGIPKAFVVGVFGGLTGLLFNAILIDVFEASKVAFSLWLLLGVALALLGVHEFTFSKYLYILRSALTSHTAFITYLVIAVFILFGIAIPNYFVGDDFTWLKWAAQSSFSDLGKNFIDAQGFFYRPIPKFLYFVMYSLFWLKPEGYHVVSLLLFSSMSILVYLLMLRLKIPKGVSLVMSLLFATLAIHHENVFWISGMSSLLAAVGILLSIFLYHSRVRILSYAAMIFAMFSYEGALVAPIILWIFLPKKRMSSYVPLLLIPLYFVLRSFAGAVRPSGDYGYNLLLLPLNVIGNGVGYVFGSFLGPGFIEYWGQIREYLRLHKTIALLAAMPLVFVVYFARTLVKKNILVMQWILAGFVALLAYLGLGNMSERYGLVASGFFVVALGIWISQKKRIYLILVAVIIFWNVYEVHRVGKDWQKASSITSETLSIMNRQFFPLREQKSFIYINTPIRYGRAWVFSVGMDDPLWHIFRFNPWTYTTTNVTTPEAAYEMPVHDGFAPEIFIFEDYHLKRLVKIINE